MRILMVANTPPNSGGVSFHIDRLASNHRAAGHSVDVLWESSLINRAPGALRGYLFGAYATLVSVRGRYSVIHSHGADGFLIKVFLPSRRNVMTSHGDERAVPSMEGDRKSRKWTETLFRTSKMLRRARFRMALQGADVIIALHREEAEAFRRELPSSKVIVVIPNGVDPPNLIPKPEVGNVLFLGNWIQRKGADLVPEIFRLLHVSNNRSHIDLVGPPKETIEEFESSLRPYVSAAGWCSQQDVEAHLSRADCLLLPSRVEGMPIAVLQAMSYGVPFVSSDLPGVRACAQGCGIFVSEATPSSFADSLLRVMSDRNLRESLSQNCRAAVKNFSWSSVSESVRQQYRLDFT